MALDTRELQRLLERISSVDDPGTLVLADWLQAQDHPWGELIAMQHAAASSPALWRDCEAQLELYATDILGPLAGVPKSTFEWRNGFVRRASIGCNAEPEAIATAVKLLLAQPIAHVVETIAINAFVAEFQTWNDWGVSMDHVVDPWTDLAAIAALIPPRVTRVGFGGWPAPAAAAYVRMPSFATLSEVFPHLTGLELTGTCREEPGVLDLPRLVDLEVRFAEATTAAIAAIASSNVPNLERLSVWFGGESSVLVDDVYPPTEYSEADEDGGRYPDTFSADDLERMGQFEIDASVDVADVNRILAMELPALVHLGFPSSVITPAVIAAIASSKIVAQLRTLDLSKSNLDDNGATALVAAKAQLAHLESIDVRDCKLTETSAAKLTKALPNANIGTIEVGNYAWSRRRPTFHFRYVAAVE
jgi:hypothetical protein